MQLREAGIEARIMLLSEPAPAAVPDVVAHDITPVVYTEAGIDALAKGVVDAGRLPPAPGTPQGRHGHAPRRLHPRRCRRGVGAASSLA